MHLRFLSALALFDLIREHPLGEVAQRFHINRGALQTLQQQSATYACKFSELIIKFLFDILYFKFLIYFFNLFLLIYMHKYKFFINKTIDIYCGITN